MEAAQAEGAGGVSELEALDAAEVARRCGYVSKKTGEPFPKVIRALYRDGRFPAPIDPTLGTRLWRWSSLVVDDYRAGRDWRAA